jgi:hypothetical protein
MTINVLALLWPNTVKDCWIACSVSVSNDDVACMSDDDETYKGRRCKDDDDDDDDI